MRKLQFIFLILALWITALLVVRAFVCIGWVVPIRVASESMAPTLYGPHWKTVCKACGHLMLTARQRGSADQINCLNCGHSTPIANSEAQPGDRVLIDRWILRRRALERFDTVALSGRVGGRTYLRTKRLLGLPGETISIQGGNVFADDEMIQKNCDQFIESAILVHADRHRVSDAENAVAANRDCCLGTSQERLRMASAIR